MIKKEWLAEPITKQEYDPSIRDRGLKEETYLCTTRFTNETYAQNLLARKRLKKKCLYSNSTPLPLNIRQEAPVFVLELNNSENKIVGIGLIRNIWQDTIYRIYENDCYNQPYFEGSYHIHRDHIPTDQMPFIEALDNICFNGKAHLKRGHNMTRFPAKILELCNRKGFNIIEKIKDIMETHIKKRAQKNPNKQKNPNP